MIDPKQAAKIFREKTKDWKKEDVRRAIKAMERRSDTYYLTAAEYLLSGLISKGDIADATMSVAVQQRDQGNWLKQVLLYLEDLS